MEPFTALRVSCWMLCVAFILAPGALLFGHKAPTLFLNLAVCYGVFGGIFMGFTLLSSILSDNKDSSIHQNTYKKNKPSKEDRPKC